MKILLILLSWMAFASNVNCQTVKPRIINYPLDLLFKDYMEECLSPVGVYYKHLQNAKNTFIATLEFKERFKGPCDFNIMTIYNSNNIELWKLDSIAAIYTDTAYLINGKQVVECNAKRDTTAETKNPPLYTIKSGNIYWDFASQKLGKLIYIDYSKINNNSPSLRNDLRKIGLKKDEVEIYLQLLKRVRQKEKS
ncbi:hypothetical protein [Xanthocytophaga flava]|uniref:hypothetical protein n=1 Tax=Xanthocytophaga flava TaxID=3048013 RepID=UPI0028D4F1F2|nr:hypothetical protein [Xanthocytophaga flavus]MDJ1471193.1 hypothetical protein [Xanthocytophaga flavus]